MEVIKRGRKTIYRPTPKAKPVKRERKEQKPVEETAAETNTVDNTENKESE